MCTGGLCVFKNPNNDNNKRLCAQSKATWGNLSNQPHWSMRMSHKRKAVIGSIAAAAMTMENVCCSLSKERSMDGARPRGDQDWNSDLMMSFLVRLGPALTKVGHFFRDNAISQRIFTNNDSYSALTYVCSSVKLCRWERKEPVTCSIKDREQCMLCFGKRNRSSTWMPLSNYCSSKTMKVTIQKPKTKRKSGTNQGRDRGTSNGHLWEA